MTDNTPSFSAQAHEAISNYLHWFDYRIPAARKRDARAVETMAPQPISQTLRGAGTS